MIRRFGIISILGRDIRGATMLEFALITPALLLVLFGLFDISYNIYTKTLLEGAIQKAARDSTIEAASSRVAAIDTAVERAVHQIVPSASVAFSRSSYSNFSDVAQPEDFTDSDSDGICNNGEPFEDANGNGSWDADRSKAGFGGARDAVLYRVTVEYDRAFPLASLIGLPKTVQTEASTVLRNQPWNLQDITTTIGSCT